MKLCLVGGFLGSGKTTAIRHAALSFLIGGVKVGVITNDQGEDLVDTAFIRNSRIATKEVLNGCFCCNYNQLAKDIDFLRKTENAEIIFAESVGSCTDLVATIAKPFGKFSPEITVVISVFADATLLYALMSGNASFLNENVQYIYKKQLEEADILVINKIDLMTVTELEKVKQQIQNDYREKILLYQNSLEEKSIRDWMLALEHFELDRKRVSLSLDYDLYAKGEAVLAWVDQRISIQTRNNSAQSVAVRLIHTIYDAIRKKQYPIAHLKFLVDDGIKQNKISFTVLDDFPKQILLTDNRVNRISILLNARIQVEYSKLEQLVSNAIDHTEKQTGSKIAIEAKAAFQPGYPRPTHRI